MSTAHDDPSTLIQEFLGSVRVLSQTVRIAVEEPLLEKLAGGRLTFPQYKLLRLVAGTDGHSISEVASILGVSSAAASKGVDKLVRRKFLRRTEGALDRRAMHLSLTGPGRCAVQSYEAARDAKLVTIFEAAPAASLRRAIALLDRLSASLVAHGADPEELCLQCGIYFPEKCVARQLGNRKCFIARFRARGRVSLFHGDAPSSKPASGRGRRAR